MWRYKSEPEDVRHIGPVAQDFRAAFNLGADDKHISTVDADGVALASVQALYQLIKERDEQVRLMRQEKDRQKQELDRKVERLERQLAQQQSQLRQVLRAVGRGRPARR